MPGVGTGCWPALVSDPTEIAYPVPYSPPRHWSGTERTSELGDPTRPYSRPGRLTPMSSALPFMIRGRARRSPTHHDLLVRPLTRDNRRPRARTNLQKVGIA
jgi:hypothetical protein